MNAPSSIRKYKNNTNTTKIILFYEVYTKALPNGISKTSYSCDSTKLYNIDYQKTPPQWRIVSDCKCNIEEAFIYHPNFLQYPIFFILIGGELGRFSN